MKQQYLEFEIVHQQIRRTDDFFVVGGSANYLKARFKFCDDWQDEEQIAIFSGGGHAYAVPIVDGECFVPWEVLRLNLFFVSCMAGERITSNSVVVDVCPCGTSDNLEESLEPTPTVIDAKIAAAVDKYMQDIPNKEEFDGVRINEYIAVRSLDGDGEVKLSVYGTTDDKDQRLVLESDRNAPRICGVGEPIDKQDAATKSYVDSAIQTALAAIPIAEESVY